MKLKVYIKLYMKMSSMYIKRRMTYRSDFIISSFGTLIMNISEVLAIFILLRSINTFKGWSYYDMVFMYSFSLLTLMPADIFFNNFWNLKTHIQEGSFIKHYFRPMDIMFGFTSEVVNINGLTQGMFGVSLLIWSMIKINYAFSFINIVTMIVVIIFSSLIMISILVMSASTSFWIMNSDSVMTLAMKFKEYAKYPMTIYGKLLRCIFTYIIPVGFISFYPSDYFLHPDSFDKAIIMLPVVSSLLFFISYKVFRAGAKYYSGTGS